MANTNNNDTPILFSGTSTVSSPKALSTTSRFEFDAITIGVDAVRGSLTVTLDNPSSASSGDYVDLQIKYSADGSTYDTDEHAIYLPRMNTYGSEDPGEDPCTRTFALDVSGMQSFKLVAKSNQSTRQITLAAVYNEHRMA
jgi:hypothetical protein